MLILGFLGRKYYKQYNIIFMLILDCNICIKYEYFILK